MPGCRETVCFKRKPARSEDTVVHDENENEKRLDDGCQRIETPVGKDADGVQGCEGSTMSRKQQDENWERNVRDEVGM